MASKFSLCRAATKQLSRRSRRRRKKSGAAMHFHSFECDHLNYRPFTPYTHFYSWTYQNNYLARLNLLNCFFLPKCIFREECRRLSIGPCLPCGPLPRFYFTLWHRLSAFASHPPLISNCQPLLLKRDMMRCLPLCPLPNCQSSHRKLGAPSPLAKRISCTLHSYGRCNSDKMENQLNQFL